MVINSGINYTIVRPSCAMQYFSKHIASDIKKGTVYSSTNEGKIAWLDSRDIATFIVAILKNPNQNINKTFTISGNESISIAEAVNRIGKAIQKDITYHKISQNNANEKMRKNGMSDFVIDMLASVDGMRSCLLYTSPSPRDATLSRMPSSA